MRVLLAFDKFKDSLTAREAGACAAAALGERHPDWTLDICALSDGGEGFAEILTSAVGGRFERAEVTGPRGVSVRASIGLVPLAQIPAAARSFLPAQPPGSALTATLAVIDMASASGLALLSPAERDVWQTTTAGTGELIRIATDLGAAGILLGVGGSATHDLGLGALGALGLQYFSDAGETLFPPVPARWLDLSRIAGSLNVVPPIRIACDVSNPLLGPRGAAATYGPQKGLRLTEVMRLDEESARIAALLCAACHQSMSLVEMAGAGAAGGIAFGLMAATGARLVPGFELVSAWLDLEARLAAADIVITGEGRFDDSSLHGKGPGAVAARALQLGKQVHVFAGAANAVRAPADLAQHSITPAGVPLEQALPRAAEYLAEAIRTAF